jgi:hypothetical protein
MTQSFNASRSRWESPALILGAGIFLYVNLFMRPGLPYLLGGDQAYFWTYAQRMFHGERVYRDFFQFSPPGADLVFLGVFRIFGVRIAPLNWVVLILGVALCWIVFRLARRVGGRGYTFLAALLFLTLIYTRLLNATHHFFALLAILCAVLILNRASSRWKFAAAGASLGCASFFTQTHGAAALAAFSAFIIWDASNIQIPWHAVAANLLLLWACFAGAIVLLQAPFALTAGLKSVWDSEVVYPPKYMVSAPNLPNLGLPERLTLSRLPIAGQPVFVYLMLPLVYAAALFWCWRKRRGDRQQHDWSMIALLSLTGLALLVEVALSPNWLRIYTVSAPGIVLFVWLLGQSGRAKKFALALVWALVLCVGGEQVWSKRHHEFIVTDLPAGRAAADPVSSEKLIWFAQHTAPGDFFLQAAWPGLYVPLDLRNPVYADAFRANSETRPEFVAEAIDALERRPVHYILWTPRLNGPDLVQPGVDFLAPLRAFLQTHYHRVFVFSDLDEVWEKS